MILARAAATGSRGCMDRIDWKRVCASGKVFAGFSDFTAFNCAAYAAGGLVTFQGPMVASDFGSPDPANSRARISGRRHARFARDRERGFTHPYTRGRSKDPCGAATWRSSCILSGRPTSPTIAGGIPLRRGDRRGSVRHRAHVPAAPATRGSSTGSGRSSSRPSPTASRNNPDRYPYSMEEVIESLRGWLPCPVLTGFRSGTLRAR
jgi:muramoyltetrapeptide carboxypeptidase